MNIAVRKLVLAGWAGLNIVVPCVGLPLLHRSDAPSDPRASAQSPQRQSDTIVKMAGPPRHQGVAALVSEMSIGGGNASADEYIFSAVSEVLPLRDGSVVVVDRGSGSSVFVRLYNAQGKYVRMLGRYGEGPGEYVAPSGIGQLADGRVVVREGRGGRINVYSATGGGQGEQLMAANYSGTSTGSDYILIAPDGTIYLRAPSRPMMGTRPAVRGGYARLRPDGSLIDTLFAPELPTVGLPQLEAHSTTGGGSATTSANVPFSPISISTFSPLGYFVTARSDRYAIDLRISPTPARAMWMPGDPVTSIRSNYTPVPVNDAERAEHRRRVEELLRGVDPGWQWSGPDIPRQKPALKAIRVASDGRLWVQLSTPSEHFDPAAEPPVNPGAGGGLTAGGGSAGSVAPRPTASPLTWREPVRYDVFEPDGTYLGAVALPFNTSINAMRGDFAWGVVRDNDGVQSVHRFRIGW